jgi:hypothetical protein
MGADCGAAGAAKADLRAANRFSRENPTFSSKSRFFLKPGPVFGEYHNETTVAIST